MGFLTRLLRPQASASADRLEEVLRGYHGGPSASGIYVGPESALRVSTYFACVQVLAQDLGKLPLHLYRRNRKGGRERASGHRAHRLMHSRPNGFQTPMGFRESGTAQLALRGDFVALKNTVRGEVRELLPVHPTKVKIEQAPDYVVTYTIGGEQYSAEEVFHVPGLSLNGYSGISVAGYARETIGLSLATEAHGARLFGKGALFRGILTHPGKFRDEAAQKRVKESLDTAYAGENAHGTALLEEGMSYEKISMSAEDSQFLQTREFQAYEVARWFRMPPHKVGLLAKATFSNIEHQALEYVIDTLLPWIVRWEQQCNADLLTPAEQEDFYFEFLVDGLLRGDQKTRYQAYKDAILTGWMNRNEVRQLENRNPEEGLDEFLEPMNMRNPDDDA